MLSEGKFGSGSEHVVNELFDVVRCYVGIVPSCVAFVRGCEGIVLHKTSERSTF